MSLAKEANTASPPKPQWPPWMPFSISPLELHGLMTMAPFSRHPESARPYFQKLRELKNACEDQLGAPLPELSMGMSGDYEIAIEEGATLIRLGTALFGPRVAANKD